MKELTAVTERPDRPLRIAIIGAGPAGVYTADILTKALPSVKVKHFASALGLAQA